MGHRFLIYAIPKDSDDDMTGGKGLVTRKVEREDRVEAELAAEEWIFQNSSPDNPDRYRIEEDA